MIPFNKPYLTGNELHYIEDAVSRGKISGNGFYTQACQAFFEKKYGFGKCLLTTSCTDALEMCALLLNIKEGDEVIMPSYTFVSTANAFVMRGAKIVFADSKENHPNIDETKIEELITPKTRAIVVVHYAGIACEMDAIMKIAQKHDLFVVEDAAQAVDSYYIMANGQKKALGAFGHLSAFSFHETKNIQCGEGGMLVINDKQFAERAEILWEKGTNRAAFFRGEIDKYGWVDIGSSFLPSEVTAAFLWAQIEKLDDIQSVRKENWNAYFEFFTKPEFSDFLKLPFIPENAIHNAHAFYLVSENLAARDNWITFFKERNIYTVFHYQSLHDSPFFKKRHDGRNLIQSDRYSDSLFRMPLFYDLNINSLIADIK